jgi:hypothetical protein
MVFREQQPLRGAREAKPPQLLCDHGLLKQLLAHPQRHRHRKATIPARRERQICLDQSLEFHERLFVECDGVDRIRCDSGVLETETDSGRRETCVVLAACEAFLLCGGDDSSVYEERRRAVVVVRG